jgi:DNA-binding NtrC family response regulator
MECDYSNKKIVVLEDNPIWTKTLRLWLSHYGSTDTVFFDNQEEYYVYALKNSNDIDVCIIDFYIGNNNTQNLIKKLRDINSDLLIIAISADFVSDKYVLDTEEMIKAIYAGANRATIKDINHLKEVLDSHLCLREMDLYDEIKTESLEIINKKE